MVATGTRSLSVGARAGAEREDRRGDGRDGRDPSGPTRNILVAAGESGLHQILVVTVALDEGAVLAAMDGAHAWALAQNWRPAVALVGPELADCTGVELTRRIKRDPGLSETAVIYLPQYGDEVDIAAGLAAGADHCLSRPFSPLELLTIVETALHRADRPASRYRLV